MCFTFNPVLFLCYEEVYPGLQLITLMIYQRPLAGILIKEAAEN